VVVNDFVNFSVLSLTSTPHGDRLLDMIENQNRRPPLTCRAAAEALNLSEPTIRAWIARRKIGVIRLGRAVRIPFSEIQRLIDAGTIPPLPNG
jgi:excisionase family DNA binding protein